MVDAFSGLAETSADIDTDQLAKSLTTLSDLTRNTPEEFRGALEGVSKLSETIASRDDQINSLLNNLERVSTVLDDRDQDIVQLMRDSDVLFQALVSRRDAIHDLLVSTSTLSEELTTLVTQSRADLKPALDHLENVVGVLNKNEDNIDNSIRLMAPFYRVFANTLGTGPWFDTFIMNLPPLPGPGGGLGDVKIPGVATDDPATRHHPRPHHRAAHRGSAGDVHRRLRPEDRHGVLPAHHLDLRGQRRPGPRRAGRHHRHGGARGHPGQGHDELRLGGEDPEPGRGRDHLPVDRR